MKYLVPLFLYRNDAIGVGPMVGGDTQRKVLYALYCRGTSWAVHGRGRERAIEKVAVVLATAAGNVNTRHFLTEPCRSLSCLPVLRPTYLLKATVSAKRQRRLERHTDQTHPPLKRLPIHRQNILSQATYNKLQQPSNSPLETPGALKAKVSQQRTSNILHRDSNSDHQDRKSNMSSFSNNASALAAKDNNVPMATASTTDGQQQKERDLEYHRQVLKSKMEAQQAGSYVSPSDEIMSPCTAKLNALRNKQVGKYVSPVSFLPSGRQEISANSNRFRRVKPKSLFAQASSKRLQGQQSPFGSKATPPPAVSSTEE